MKYRSSRNICIPQTNCSRLADRPLEWAVATFTGIFVNILSSSLRSRCFKLRSFAALDAWPEGKEVFLVVHVWKIGIVCCESKPLREWEDIYIVYYPFSPIFISRVGNGVGKKKEGP